MSKVSGVCLASLLCAISTHAYGVDIIPANSNYYYQLGGGSALSMPAVSNQQDVTLGAGIDTNLTDTCGFNPAVSISNTINNIEDSLQGIKDGVIQSATSAVGSMPMYLLSKSNKDLYNLIQNTISSAQETFNLSEKSCSTAMQNIKDGKNPYADWFSVSDSQGWLQANKQAKQGQDVDVNKVKKNIEKDPKQYGVPWVHKEVNSGGTQGNQVPIKVIYDVVVAGFNAMVDPKNSLDAKNTQAPSDSGLIKYWKSANDAGNWATLVLGDITITSREGQDTTMRSSGLMGIIQTCPKLASNNKTCAKTIQKNMVSLVQGQSGPTAEDLSKVSSNEMMATPTLIDAIRNKPKDEQGIAISKWSQDVAIQNVVDEALMLRRVLIAGSQTKPVHNLKPALDMVDRSISQLNKDISDILFQFNIRKELMGNTAQTILGHQVNQEGQAASLPGGSQAPLIQGGAVYKNKGEQ